MKPFWLSWVHKGGDFTLSTPWWVTGYDPAMNPTICAAIVAGSEAEARMKVHDAYTPAGKSCLPSFRFVEERPQGWAPFCDRFPQAPWMEWAA